MYVHMYVCIHVCMYVRMMIHTFGLHQGICQLSPFETIVLEEDLCMYVCMCVYVGT